MPLPRAHAHDPEASSRGPGDLGRSFRGGALLLGEGLAPWLSRGYLRGLEDELRLGGGFWLGGRHYQVP